MTRRGCTIDAWQEPNGYWSADVVVRIPHLPDWQASATNFHNITEALDWARSQIAMAVASAS